ncbi:c-type cytochrome [Novosphingobium album (ex Liu et al. 2023)]|uniref:C-type cytochrome n=1 Tax=Novosphingobium album (ex Liu et al. 2023) TaxID=3031130 RepID=A0ABT5WRY3_9SPHN|nr:c-type cytochrome [Novosphingobium album (ex Liu et al. 2023)]MDE8652804.1 c-type cytochrome [Novosphingobium album (ex Liu et al. 2023)]
MRVLVLGMGMVIGGALLAGSAAPRGNAARGGDLYRTKCGACHSLDNNRVGPAHRGVVGRRSGTAPGFRYSRALSSSNIVWTPANLDRWLTAPTLMVPGTAMGFRLASPQDRADVIAYLQQNGSAR